VVGGRCKEECGEGEAGRAASLADPWPGVSDSEGQAGGREQVLALLWWLWLGRAAPLPAAAAKGGERAAEAEPVALGSREAEVERDRAVVSFSHLQR